jgi:hypothetical protein
MIDKYNQDLDTTKRFVKAINTWMLSVHYSNYTADSQSKCIQKKIKMRT